MKERAGRLRAIKQIIRSHRITSQERLLERLESEGFTVAQATLSRDLRVLKVVKVTEGGEGPYYTMPSEEERRESQQSFVQDFLRGFISIEFSGNLAVVKTHMGHANSVALALDNLGIDEIIGTIAGDDTVLAVLRAGVSDDDLLNALHSRVPDLEE